MKTTHLFESKCTKAKIYVENDMAIGVFHDFLMEIKGLMVDRMIAAHQEQVKQTQEQIKEFPQEGSCSQQCEVKNDSGE